MVSAPLPVLLNDLFFSLNSALRRLCAVGPVAAPSGKEKELQPIVYFTLAKCTRSSLDLNHFGPRTLLSNEQG